MSDDPSLLSVIVGGAIGVAGTLSVLWFQTTCDRKKRRSEKFQELVSAVYDTDHWLTRLGDHRLFGGPAPTEASPLGKAETIATVYFTSLRSDINVFAIAVGHYQSWQLDMAQKRIADPSTNLSAGHAEAYNPYLFAREALLKKLSDYARHEFQ